MSLNSNAHFAHLPNVGVRRSLLDRSHDYKFTGNVGDLIPVYNDPDILPGDTVSLDISSVIRFQTMLSRFTIIWSRISTHILSLIVSFGIIGKTLWR